MSDAVIIQTSVGPLTPGSDGVQGASVRTGKTGELSVGLAHGRYWEPVSRGKCYMAANQAEVTYGTVLTATAVTFTLWNPLGSPVDLVLLHCAATLRTCTTAGHLVYAANVNPAAAIPATNTELVVRNARLDGAAGYAKVYSATTLPAAPVAVRSLATGFFVGTTPAMALGFQISDYVDGAIVLGPNTAITVQGITVVGTGIVSMLWEEVLRPV